MSKKKQEFDVENFIKNETVSMILRTDKINNLYRILRGVSILCMIVGMVLFVLLLFGTDFSTKLKIDGIGWLK